MGQICPTNPVDNIIVVGAIDQYDQRSIWNAEIPALIMESNYGEHSVDVYAPGSAIYTTFPQNQYDFTQYTSFATPYVTGVAALLMSVAPNLSATQIKKYILDGADAITITIPDGSTQNVRRLNAAGALKCLFDDNVTSYTMGQTDKSFFSTINPNSEFVIGKTIVRKIEIPYDEEFTFEVSSTGNFSDVVLYDEELNIVNIDKTWNSGSWTMVFTKELSAGVYYLQTKITNSPTSSQGQLTTISHEHTYSEWTYYSPTQHKECCACGVVGTAMGVHVTKQSLIIGNKADCIICGYAFDLDDGFGQIIHTVQKVSVNGSYILPSGIIVLVDEDVEAYEN